MEISIQNGHTQKPISTLNGNTTTSRILPGCSTSDRKRWKIYTNLKLKLKLSQKQTSTHWMPLPIYIRWTREPILTYFKVKQHHKVLHDRPFGVCSVLVFSVYIRIMMEAHYSRKLCIELNLKQFLMKQLLCALSGQRDAETCCSNTSTIMWHCVCYWDENFAI